MSKTMRRISCWIFLLACASQAFAQSYPSKPVRIIVPYSAGGGTDIVARAVGAKLADKWHQSVIVDNRVGANGIIGADAVAKAPADGYTLLMSTPAEVSTNPHLYANIPYNAERDFAPVSLIAVTPLVVAVNPGVPAKSVQELIALAKENPASMGFATPGLGSTQHLSGEMLMMSAGIKLVHVPYKGAGQSIPDVIGGQVPMGIYGVLTISQHAKAGRLRMLAVTTPKRSSAYPDLPTLAESGFPGFDTSLWFGLLAPAATPKPVIGKLHDDVIEMLNLPEVKERIASQGADIVGDTPAEFAAFIAAESAKYAKIIKQAGVKLE
jgi:tripartite-type tricarboxylate transporter receptor subunit TctC